MSYMKREFEDEHPEIFGALHCLVCGVEATPELKGRRVGFEGWLCHDHIAADPCDRCGEFGSACICPDVASEGQGFYPGDEAALTEAIDAHVARTSEELDDEAFFAPWAEAMVRAEVSRGMLDGMWERIKIRLDDLGKVDQLIADVFGHRARMVP
jgi:hypothetical protein